MSRLRTTTQMSTGNFDYRVRRFPRTICGLRLLLCSIPWRFTPATHISRLCRNSFDCEALCLGMEYFTTPQTLGNYLMMDFLNRKMKTVH